VGILNTQFGTDEGNGATGSQAATTMQQGLGAGAADVRQLHDKAYFLDLLGDSHHGLGRHEEAIEAYRQAAQGLREQGAQCSYALCLLKVVESYLSLDEPWHAVGYLEACLPLLQELGLRRHETHADQQLARCRAALAEVRLRLGRGGPASVLADRDPPARPAGSGPVAAHGLSGVDS
jgi:tetratricopeptide (TPR) repeat protein